MTFNKFRSIYDAEELKARLANIRHVALDMDGTIYMGMSLFDYTIPFLQSLREMGITYSFLTNNPSTSIPDYLKKLAGMGIEATEEEMYTTALATIDYIKTNFPEARRLFLLGTPSMISEFEKAGFESLPDSAEERPDVLVVAFDKTLEYSRLCRAAYWAQQGLELTIDAVGVEECDAVCKNYDIIMVGPQIGYRLAQIKADTGMPCDVIPSFDYAIANCPNIMKLAEKLYAQL
jgi:ribonucleotide monophosphatase NagD (HAD superfamily)